MDKQEIIEGNKLIAGFVGLKLTKDKDCYPDHPEYHWSEDGEEYNLLGTNLHWHFENPPPFDSSWDWLMPACKKFDQLKASDIIFDEYDRRCKLLNTILTHTWDCKEVFTQLAENIQWYNSQKQ